MLPNLSNSRIVENAVMRLLFFVPVFILFSCRDSEVEPAPAFTFLSRIDVPGFTRDVWGYEVDGREYAIVASVEGDTEDGKVSIVDVTDPSHPVVVSTMAPGGYDVKVWSHYLYVAQGSNTDGAKPSQIFDISNPLAPVEVGSFPAVHNIFIDDAGYLYTTGYFANLQIPNSASQNASIYDLNPDPANPEFVWTAPNDEAQNAPAHDISVIRNKMYLFNSHTSRVEIFDVTNQSSPLFLGKYQFPNLQVHSGWVTEDDKYLFVCLEEEEEEDDVIILDISNPASPFEVGTIHDTQNTVHNLYIIDDYAYVSFYSAGLRIYDVSNPQSPVLAYEYDTNGSADDLGAFGVYPFAKSGHLYVSDVKNGLFVFRQD